MALVAENILLNRAMRFAQTGQHLSTTLLTTTVPTTLTPPAGAISLLMQATGQTVRYVLGGTVSPTTVTGFYLAPGDLPTLIVLEPNSTISCVQAAAGATLDYAWGGDL